MRGKLTDGQKADLAKVVCDNYICMERGERGRCYLDIYKFCEKYITYKGEQENERFK